MPEPQAEEPRMAIYDEEELTPEHARRQAIFEQTMLVESTDAQDQNVEMSPTILIGVAVIISGAVLLVGALFWNLFLT
ncbi:MAG: hypothetical protein KC496_07935 [Anaerolineae bacterium]|nr:hypothetical protein [Anaerolineae bacterium]